MSSYIHHYINFFDCIDSNRMGSRNTNFAPSEITIYISNHTIVNLYLYTIETNIMNSDNNPLKTLTKSSLLPKSTQPTSYISAAPAAHTILNIMNVTHQANIQDEK